MRKLPFRKQSSGDAPSKSKKRKLFSFLRRTVAASKEDTFIGEQQAIQAAQSCQTSHLAPVTQERVTLGEEEDAPRPQPEPASTQHIISEPIPVRGSEATERCYCHHGSQAQNLPSRPSDHALFCVCCGRCQKCAGRSLCGSYPRCEICHSKSHLLELPTELQMEIIRYLDFPATWLLKLSSKVLYGRVPAPIGPWDKPDIITLLSRLRSSVPSRLRRCDQCLRYHSSSPKLQYTWVQTNGVEIQFCLRHLDRTDLIPVAPGLEIGTVHYICRHCRHVRDNSQCITCGKCESCAGIAFRGHSIECIECDAGKARCTRCRTLRLPHRACRGCGVCEDCAGGLFQFGTTHCVGCGGSPVPNHPRTRRALVESGPGYEMYFYNPQGNSLNRDRRIGIR
jgi:hypothetical protein